MDMLRITNLHKRFGDKEVLSGLNLTVSNTNCTKQTVSKPPSRNLIKTKSVLWHLIS